MALDVVYLIFRWIDVGFYIFRFQGCQHKVSVHTQVRGPNNTSTKRNFLIKLPQGKITLSR